LKIYDHAVRFLARREHSAKELLEKLLTKGYLLSDIQETIARLQAENLQSETRFIESRIRARISQGKGPRWLLEELQEHGFPTHQIKLFLEQAEVCWFTLAAQVREQRFGSALPDNFPDKAKQMRFLQYRGFDSEQIKKAMPR
jgi:regulatory protein